jgi:hypothetical protein
LHPLPARAIRNSDELGPRLLLALACVFVAACLVMAAVSSVPHVVDPFDPTQAVPYVNTQEIP